MSYWADTQSNVYPYILLKDKINSQMSTHWGQLDVTVICTLNLKASRPRAKSSVTALVTDAFASDTDTARGTHVRLVTQSRMPIAILNLELL